MGQLKYDATNAELLAQGYAYKKLARGPKTGDGISTNVEARTNPRDNTFDKSFSPGILPAWIRKRGGGIQATRPFGPAYLGTRDFATADPVEYPSRPASEGPYVDALSEFFDTHIALWPGTDSQREYLRVLMTDRRSTRDLAEVGGVSQPAIVQGRQRAVDSFVKHMGGKAALAEKLRTYLHDRETQDGRDRLKYLPRWIHG